jgi:methylthioribose-1-phosphate isomerase
MTQDLLRPVLWKGNIDTGYVWMIEQRLLPGEFTAVELHSHRAVADAIRDMIVRGAPAIGVSAAFGVVLAAREALDLPSDQTSSYFDAALELLASTRPTAVNLFWAIEIMRKVFEQHAGEPKAAILEALHTCALRIQSEDTAANLAMGDLGAALLKPGTRILTHCNAGALATSAYGTALGVIRSAHRDGLLERVYADETRPYLQGARLTAWELQRENIPVTLITDSMAGHMMQQGHVDTVVVGSDRVAANGDVANKIGTYSLAVLARHHGIPFYVAAPTSTIDRNCASGADIPIEQRAAGELTLIGGISIAPEGIDVAYPAFDVTPAALVTAIITEKGIAKPPSCETIAALFEA